MLRQIKGKLARNKTLYDFYKRMKVAERSPYENIYHCCTQKTASQWFKAVFQDPVFYKYTGLEAWPFSQIPDTFQQASITEPLPKNTVGTTMYIDHPTFLDIPKPSRYKAFFVLRDPRDIVVSWYYSVIYSHVPRGTIPVHREKLGKLDLQEGFRYSMDWLNNYGLFSGQRSWVEARNRGSRVKIFRYEDLAKDNKSFLASLLEFLEVNLPQGEFEELYSRHSFEALSSGRKSGEEDVESHLRKGTAGDWIERFDSETVAYFNQLTGDLALVLGYGQ